MRNYRMAFAAIFISFFLGASRAAAQDSRDTSGKSSLAWYNPARYNPLKLFKRGPKSANDQLAPDAVLEKRLTSQLQAQRILPVGKDLRDACSTFRDLPECIAVLRLSRSLQIEFACLKWDVTGLKPKAVPDSCAGPASGKAMRLEKAVDLLKPDANAKAEASNALQKARNDIADAKS